MGKFLNFIKKEFCGWGRYEKIIFSLEIAIIACISIYIKDSKIALISAICGICATILAGKGKISCYFFGIICNVCYSYISYKNAFWGNLGLNMLYYLPMQFVGISKWKNHMKHESQEIYKTMLTVRERIIYSAISVGAILIGYFILLCLKDANPLIDSATTTLSIIAFILTVKRCIEQWYVWTIVNALSVIMWIGAYIDGSNCMATVLMWSTYLALGIYFLMRWGKEIGSERTKC